MSLPVPGESVKPKGIVVFSGGSAANNLVDVFKTVAERKECSLSYVIPISDNGGSTSELIRVFGGPGESSSLSQRKILTSTKESVICEVSALPFGTSCRFPDRCPQVVWFGSFPKTETLRGLPSRPSSTTVSVSMPTKQGMNGSRLLRHAMFYGKVSHPRRKS